MSVLSHGRRLVYWGSNTCLYLFFWFIQRLGRLVREGKLTEALQLGMELFDGTAKAVVGQFNVYRFNYIVSITCVVFDDIS